MKCCVDVNSCKPPPIHFFRSLDCWGVHRSLGLSQRVSAQAESLAQNWFAMPPRLSAGDALRPTRQSSADTTEFSGLLWAEERVRRRGGLILFAAAMIAVSAVIDSDDYNPAVWLSTILGRIFPVILFGIACAVPLKDIGRWWSPALAFMYVQSRVKRCLRNGYFTRVRIWRR